MKPILPPSLFFLPRSLLGVLASAWLISGYAWGQRIHVAENDISPVVVEEADVTVQVTGRFAVTTFDLVFRNPNERNLEGSFEFPLQDGQTVAAFALDVAGHMRDAVPVEKDRARIVFEEIERRQVDPGLLEQVAGNIYRARVFPLPARGTRRIRLSYEEALLPEKEETLYRLGLDFSRALKHFRLRVNVHSGTTLPALARTSLNLQLPPWRDRQYMEIERLDFEARGVFEIVLPKMERPRALTGDSHGRDYFYAEVPSTPILFTRPAPKIVGIIWDSSLTGGERDHAKEFAVLNAWLGELQNVEVRLWRIRDRVTREGTYAVRGGDWQTLRKELESTVYDGATALDGFADDPKVEAWLLFTDGFFNYGTQPVSRRLPVQGVVHVVNSTPRSATAWLRSVAASGNGEYVDLLKAEPAAAAFTLQTQSTRILAVEGPPDDVSELYPQPGTPIAGDSFSIAGILHKRSTVLRLVVGNNRQNAVSIEVPVMLGEHRTDLAPRAWARAKLDHLSAEPEANRSEIERVSRDFGLATSSTSLLVLESVEDYLRHGIDPPAELKDEWEARRQATTLTQRTLHDHRESVVQAFQSRVAWWEQTFPAGAPPKRTETQPNESSREEDDTLVLSLFTVARTRARPAERTAAAATVSGPDGGPAVENAAPPGAVITLKRWSPQAGYIERVQKARAEHRYSTYLKERAQHEREPGFYLDVADALLGSAEGQELALRILSNLAELELDEPALLRVLGHRLLQADRPRLALPLFERVLALRPEEPQSRRDLALACELAGHSQRAVDLLWEIVSQPWDSRFPGIELIALEEMNAIIATAGRPLDVSRIDPRLLKNMPLDLRIVLTWDANECDMDLWVTDPNEQTCRYDFPLTYQGGLLSSDFTGGYGPEEFLLRKAKPGRYVGQINYYGDRRQNAFGPVTAQVRFITGFGTAQQQEKRVTVRLKNEQETLEIGTIEVGGRKGR